MPESWHKQSALWSPALAVLLFLSFHRLLAWFERHVERLFFASCQRTEADLKRFVASAGHFHQGPAPCHEFTAEVERFAQGAAAALYLREDCGGFVRQCGSLEASPSYAEEDRAFALLAAERAPVELVAAHGACPARWLSRCSNNWVSPDSFSPVLPLVRSLPSRRNRQP